MACSDLIASLVAGQCGKAPIGGTGGRVVFVNYADVDKDTSTVTGGELTKLALKSGKNGYLFETLKGAVEASCTFNKGTYFSYYTHSVQPFVYVDDKAAWEWLQAMKYARVIALVESADKSTWRVYGWDSGLEMSENSYSSNYDDHTVYKPVLSSNETAVEGSLPLFFAPTGGAEAAVLELLAD